MLDYIIGLVLVVLILYIAIGRKALTLTGIISSFIILMITWYTLGIAGVYILCATFILLVAADKLSKKKRHIDEEITDKSGSRDHIQILANCLISSIMAILFYIYKNDAFLIGFAVSLAESLSDSMASDIGVLTRFRTINLLTFKTEEKGMSGNVSILGFIASLVGSLTIGLLFCLAFHKPYVLALFIGIIGFLGAYFDSLFGAIMQVKYRCPKCKRLTEKKLHCKGTKTRKIGGIKWIDNDMINFISNLTATLIALAILI